MSIIEGGNTIAGTLGMLRNAGAPVNGTSAKQTITINAFGANTLNLSYEGFSTQVVFVGNEANGAIDTLVKEALESLHSIGTGGVTVATTGSTNRVIAITFAGNLAKLEVPIIGASVTGASAVQASYTTSLTGTDNDLVYTAVEGGTDGNSLKIAYVDPGANDAISSVTVAGTTITVNLATGAAGAITSTGASVLADIQSSVPANTLVTVANSGSDDGSGVVTALAAASFTGGSAGPVASVVDTTPGVTATQRGALEGALLNDYTTPKLYQNTGTASEPTWTAVGGQS